MAGVTDGNLDGGGVKRRFVAGLCAFAVTLGVSAWMVTTGQPLLLRITVALLGFGFASLSLFQARAKT